MHNITTFATALAMTSLFAGMFWAQLGVMATDAAGFPAKPESRGIASDAYQNVVLTYGPSLGEFAGLAR